MRDRIAVIGDGDEILIYRASGFDTFEVSNETIARSTLKDLIKTYKLIFITNKYASNLKDIIDNSLKTAYPIIIPLQSDNSSISFGVENLKTSVERALGFDVLNIKEKVKK